MVYNWRIPASSDALVGPSLTSDPTTEVRVPVVVDWLSNVNGGWLANN